MDATPFINWSLIIVIAGVLVAGFVFSAIGARHTAVRRDESRGKRVATGFGAGGALSILAVLGVLLVGGSLMSYRAVEYDAKRQQEFNEELRQEKAVIHQELDATSDAVIESDRLLEAKEDGGAEDAAADRELPEWTQAAGEIADSSDEVTLVAESELCATAAEALEEATVRAMATLKDRIVADAPGLESWDLPLQVFKRSSVQLNSHVDVQTHEFGGIQEPMFRAYIQYRDSDSVRKQFLNLWQDEVVTDRAIGYGGGLGVFAVGLALISAMLRAVLGVFRSKGGSTS